MDSDDDLLDSIAGPNEPSYKRQRRIDTSAFEDIARELEEGASPPSRSRSEGGDGEDDDPDTWLLGQCAVEDEGEGEGAWTSEEGEGAREGMDVDVVEELEAELLDMGGGGERDKEREKPRPPIVVLTTEPAEEKAAYTSSGRLLVPSHKSREAKAAAGAMAQAWEEMEMQGLGIFPPKKKSGSKSKSKSSASKAPGSNNASGSGTPQPRAGGAASSKSGSSKSKSLATAVNKSAAAGLALAATKAAMSKSKKKGDTTSKKSKDKEARSRSESRQVETPAPEAVLQAVAKVAIVEPAEEEEEDNRLYCICKTKYDEERSMIACDRCDDWYHPSCVGLPERDIDLIDQFVCPLCVSKYNAHTTYKARCAVRDCTKPARAPVSKYCSHACGLKNAAAQLQTWRARGINMDQLWYAAKDARAPEGVVYVHLPGGPIPHPPPAGVNYIGPNATRVIDGRRKADLESLATMGEALEQSAARRETLELDIRRLKARLRLLGCAMRRAEKVGGERCGFDARMVMNDEEWEEWLGGDGKWTLEEQVEGEEQKDDEAYERDEGSFCAGKKRCERHYGWQNLKFADFSGECTAKASLSSPEFQLADVNAKSQETRRKMTELRRMMSSMARPLAERITLPPDVDDAMIA